MERPNMDCGWFICKESEICSPRCIPSTSFINLSITVTGSRKSTTQWNLSFICTWNHHLVKLLLRMPSVGDWSVDFNAALDAFASISHHKCFISGILMTTWGTWRLSLIKSIINSDEQSESFTFPFNFLCRELSKAFLNVFKLRTFTFHSQSLWKRINFQQTIWRSERLWKKNFRRAFRKTRFDLECRDTERRLSPATSLLSLHYLESTLFSSLSIRAISRCLLRDNNIGLSDRR